MSQKNGNFLLGFVQKNGVDGEKEEMVPRSFLDMGVAEKDEASQQSSEEKLRESKSVVDLMHRCKGNEKDVEEKSDCGRESSKARTEGDQELSNKVPKLDQNSETLSMIKKARVSVRARSDSTMVSKLNNKQK